MGDRKAILMNITVKTYGQTGFACRPDTTWERENKDFYSPEFIKELQYTPVIFARISKAGKFIGEKFVSRYYDGMNFGMLMYPGEILRKNGLAFASVLDHSSLLPFPLYLPEVFSASGNGFIIEKNGERIFSASTDGKDYVGIVENAICEASRYISQRIGDIVAIELEPPAPLVNENEKRAGISASFCGNELFRLSVIK